MENIHYIKFDNVYDNYNQAKKNLIKGPLLMQFIIMMRLLRPTLKMLFIIIIAVLSNLK